MGKVNEESSHERMSGEIRSKLRRIKKIKDKTDPAVARIMEAAQAKSEEELLFLWLREGVVLCHLVNLIKPDAVAAIHEEVTSKFLCKENVFRFLAACKTSLNIDYDKLFSVSDLYNDDSKTHLKVLILVQILLKKGEDLKVIEYEAEDESVNFKKLSPEQMLQKVVDEIVTTEIKYVEDLKVLRENADLFSKAEGISSQDAYDIFCNIRELEKFQIEFLADLQQTQSDLGSTFLKWAKKFSIFTPYCINHEKAGEKVKLLRDKLLKARLTLDPDFALPSYLLKPVQRICKYPLLLRELIKHTESDTPQYKALNSALSEMKTVTVFINELKRRRESMTVVAELEKRIDNWKGCDLRCYGELKLDDTMTLIFGNGKKQQEMHFFLFEKLFMFATETFKKKETIYHMRGKLQLRDSLATIEAFQKKDTYFFKLLRKDDPDKSIIVQAESQKQCDEWVNAIKGMIQGVGRSPSIRVKVANAAEKLPEDRAPAPRAAIPAIMPEAPVQDSSQAVELKEPKEPVASSTEAPISQPEERAPPPEEPAPAATDPIAEEVAALTITEANSSSSPENEALDSCPYCKELIQPDAPCAQYSEWRWHADHFKCVMCDKNLVSEPFFLRDESLYCREDYMEHFSPRCSGCGGIIEQEYIEHIGETWHKEHFCCAHCHTSLDNVPFYEVDGMPYCVDDYTNLFGSRCHVCDGLVEENGLECAGKSFHHDCFGCRTCKISLHDVDFFDHEGEIYCELHYFACNNLLCEKCQGPLKENYVVVDDLKYHEACYS